MFLRQNAVRMNTLLKNVRQVNRLQIKNAANICYCDRDIKNESEEQYLARHVKNLNMPDLDCWELRKIFQDIMNVDHIPEPKIICAALRACRRLNDFALTIRILEAVKVKCGHREKEIYPWIMQEIGPTMDELGISTIEQMGYDKPELALVDIYSL